MTSFVSLGPGHIYLSLAQSLVCFDATKVWEKTENKGAEALVLNVREGHNSQG